MKGDIVLSILSRGRVKLTVNALSACLVDKLNLTDMKHLLLVSTLKHKPIAAVGLQSQSLYLFNYVYLQHHSLNFLNVAFYGVGFYGSLSYGLGADISLSPFQLEGRQLVCMVIIDQRAEISWVIIQRSGATSRDGNC